MYEEIIYCIRTSNPKGSYIWQTLIEYITYPWTSTIILNFWLTYISSFKLDLVGKVQASIHLEPTSQQQTYEASKGLV